MNQKLFTEIVIAAESTSMSATNTSAQGTSNASTIGLSVFVAVLMVAVLFLVLLILIVLRRANKKNQKGKVRLTKGVHCTYHSS